MASKEPAKSSKTQPLEPWNELLCPDWLWSKESNVHIANHTDWFIHYEAFPSVIHDESGHTISTSGVGTVHVPVKAGASSKRHGFLVLESTLFAPDALCCIVAGTFPGLEVVSDSYIQTSDGCHIAFFPSNRPRRTLQLSAPPRGPCLGPSALSASTKYDLTLTWEPSERRRWLWHRDGGGDPALEPGECIAQKENETETRQDGGGKTRDVSENLLADIRNLLATAEIDDANHRHGDMTCLRMKNEAKSLVLLAMPMDPAFGNSYKRDEEEL